ncbi:hypothetical protein V0288_10040 [Pannus brasiliensis CCIBt3594]|uniref:Uncharacterized protein n=1 Tax=Pannus brasiliensis CCIBt3594 TaxID=1427578 RepID=A0AAW9QK30_9CHRO
MEWRSQESGVGSQEARIALYHFRGFRSLSFPETVDFSIAPPASCLLPSAFCLLPLASCLLPPVS